MEKNRNLSTPNRKKLGKTAKMERWKDGKMKTNSIDIIVTLKPDGTHSIQENFYWKEPFKIDMR